ncbi:MAG: O-antigen ligase family protein [Kiritimatiellia bacterium]
MNWFIRNALVVNIFALVAAFSWIHGGTRPDHLMKVIPWLTFFALQVLIVFPQAKSTEDLIEARRRVWRSLRCDPLTWIALVFFVVLLIPLFNVAGAPVFDEAAQRWINPDPAKFITWLPSCVKPDQHAVLLLWFPPALTAALGARHGLLKRGKRLLLEMTCWNGAVLAVVGFAQVWSGTKSLLWFVPLESHFFSTFGYPNFAGAFFTLVFALSAGLWAFDATLFMQSEQVATLQSEKNVFVKHRMFLVAVLTFFAALATLSRAAILLSVAVAFTFSIYMLLFVWNRISQGARVKLFALVFAVLAVLTVSLMAFKFSAFKNELGTISPDAIVKRVTGVGYYHVRVAKEIHDDHQLFGVGGWGYPHYQMQYMTPGDLKRMQIKGGINVHNDARQFLAEQGYVGFGLMLACFFFLAGPLWVSVYKLIRNSFKIARVDTDNNSPAGHWFYCIPPPLVAVFIGTTATIVHSTGDLPFRNPAVLIVWVLAFTCVPGWIPLLKGKRR